MVVGYLLATVGVLGVAAALFPFREDLSQLNTAFGFLAIVVVTCAVGGFGPGVVASFVAFLSFNFLFIHPYYTFAIGRGEDVVMLFVFLGLSILISVLTARATSRARPPRRERWSFARCRSSAVPWSSEAPIRKATRRSCDWWSRGSASATARCSSRKETAEDWRSS